jgi:hypothetical protein
MHAWSTVIELRLSNDALDLLDPFNRLEGAGSRFWVLGFQTHSYVPAGSSGTVDSRVGCLCGVVVRVSLFRLMRGSGYV